MRIGRVVNFSSRNIAAFRSEVLIVLATNAEGEVMIVPPLGAAVFGNRVI